MKKAREFDTILDECLERMLVKDETLEQCLARYPEQAAELKPLLETALIAKRASAIQPRPEFKSRARHQFGAALREIKPKGRFFPLGWQPRWAMVVVVVLALLLVGGSMVAAAGTSMPDEPLYRVKLATEQVRLVLTPSEIGKAQVYASLADRRVAEMVYMVNKGKPEHLEQATRRLNTCLVMIVALARAEREEEKAMMAPTPPPLLTEGREGKGVYPQANARAKLRMTVAHYAVNHPAALRRILKTAPESTKPALLRAIAIAEARYQQALEAVAEQGGDR